VEKFTNVIEYFQRNCPSPVVCMVLHGIPSSSGVICGSSIRQTSYPQLFSYTKDKFIIVRSVLELEAQEDLFHLPLSM
jgi:hypothetical protein